MTTPSYYVLAKKECCSVPRPSNVSSGSSSRLSTQRHYLPRVAFIDGTIDTPCGVVRKLHDIGDITALEQKISFTKHTNTFSPFESPVMVTT
jgi:hypothetical protein